MAEDFEHLREKSVRSSSVYEDMDGLEGSGGGGILSQFSPIQRLILAVLVLLDIIVVGFVILSITNII